MATQTQSANDLERAAVWQGYFDARDERWRHLGELLMAKLRLSVAGQLSDPDIIQQVANDTGEDIVDVHYAWVVLNARGEVIQRSGSLVPADPE